MDDRVVGSPLSPSRLSAAPAALPVDSTIDLLRRAKSGDRDALNRLFTRYRPKLRRWASGRLPRSCRDLLDTDDLVQETLVRAINRLGHFEPQRDGALLAFLREAMKNRIIDELRRRRLANRVPIDDNCRDHGASPLEEAIGKETAALYEAALARLRPEEREAIIAKIEMDGGWKDVAIELGKFDKNGAPAADAARMAASRALLRLAEDQPWQYLTASASCRWQSRLPMTRRSTGIRSKPLPVGPISE